MAKHDKILLVEDEKTMLKIVADMLRREGYDVVTASDGKTGIKIFKSEHPDLVIADVMMPGMDGFEMVRHIRKFHEDVPMIFLTARSAIDDIVEGFEIGANDYLRKPFRMEELLVRIMSLLRRTRRISETLQIGRYVFHPALQQLHIDGLTTELSHIDTVILKSLASRINETVEARDLMIAAWQNDNPYNVNRLHGFIYKLRKYLSKDPAISILNIRGIGYKLKI